METVNSASRIDGAKRIVIKIGSALLVDGATGLLRRDWLADLAEDVAMLKADGKEVLVVSSGSIALGRRVLGFPKGALSLERAQAAAAVGQIPGPASGGVRCVGAGGTDGGGRDRGAPTLPY